MTNYTLAEAVAARALLITQITKELDLAANDLEDAGYSDFTDTINPRRETGDDWLKGDSGKLTRKFAEMLVDRMLTNPELVLERKADQKPPTGPQPHWRGGAIFATLPDVVGEHRER